MSLKRFGRELHRRSIWQVLGIYLVAAYAVFQVIISLVEGLGLPEWFPAFALVLFLIGLPIVLVTAFVQQGFRSGGDGGRALETIQLEGDDGTPPATPLAAHHRLFTWRNAILGGVAAFALWGVIAAGWVLMGGRAGVGSGAGAGGGIQSVAVLPFENLSPDEENRFFADGIHDEILAQLAKIGGLKVISRTSVLEYREKRVSLRKIGEELGVSTVLEGSVRRAGDRVRITTQLIDAQSDEHLWAETYERSLADVFAIQAEVAQQVASALNVVLGSSERAALSGTPTQNAQAYDFYLQALSYLHRPEYDRQTWNIATQMFERALALDPDFALAHAQLAYTHARIYHFGFDRTDVRLARATTALERARSLAPNLPEVHYASGYYYYWGFRDYERALAELMVAERQMPNNADVIGGIAFIRRRQGRFDETLKYLDKAARIDPRNAQWPNELGTTYRALRRYNEAQESFARSIELAPDFMDSRETLALVVLESTGDAARARELLAPFAERLEGEEAIGWVQVLLASRAYQEMLDWIARAPWERVEDQAIVLPRPLVSALAHHYAGAASQARSAFDSARVILERERSTQPDDHRARSALGLAYAGLGRHADAVREGRRAVELMPVTRDALLGPRLIEQLAWIHVLSGEKDAAVAELERILSDKGAGQAVSVQRMRLEPRWDPLRSHPRFKQLLEQYPAPK